MRKTVLSLLLLCLALVVSLSQADDCECAGNNCGCCVQIKLDDPKIDAPACVNLTYNPQTVSASVVVEVDNIVVFNRTVSLHDPDICFGVPVIPLIDLCLQFTNLQYSSNHLSGCLTIEIEAFDVTVGKFPAGCFNINVLDSQSKSAMLVLQKIKQAALLKKKQRSVTIN